jgi:DNA-binding IclR family transcriptional regulator
MRRPRGEAAELILKAVSDAHPEGLTIAELSSRTGLPQQTLRDNVDALREQGVVETFRDENRAVWVCLPE